MLDKEKHVGVSEDENKEIGLQRCRGLSLFKWATKVHRILLINNDSCNVNDMK